MDIFIWKWIYVFAHTAVFYGQYSKAQDVKTWRMDTNFNNPRNWEDGRLPCENDRVVFPASVPVITYMPQSFAASELVLPLNGELIFPTDANLRITGGKQAGSCSGKDASFKQTVDFWFDPSNWNITSDGAFPPISARRNAAVPHAFQIPCIKDTARFPAETSFRVHLDFPSISVAALEINNIAYTAEAFENLKQTHIGSLLFPDNPKIEIVPSSCTDETGCMCGNDGMHIFPTVCQYTIPCPNLECDDPIELIGHCCPICASSVVIQYESGFQIKRLLQLHQSFLGKANFQAVESFTSKTHEDNIQSVFVDGAESKGLASKVAQLVHDALVTDMNGPRLYRVKSIKILKSERWGAGVPTYDRYAKGMSSGGVAAIVMVFIVIAGGGAAFFIYKKRQIPGFSFARFDLRSDKIELELGTTPHDELQPGEPNASANGEQSSAKSFDNPVYGTEVPLSVEDSEDVPDYVENKMYMIFEDTDGQNTDGK